MSQERIGRYGILERIAAGGQATVYRAWDSETGQVVALKVLHPHLTHDADYIKRFQLEARLSVNITHPNVISVYEVAQHGESHFISMEYLPESLSRVLEVQGRFPIDRAVNIAHQICRGLQAAYDAGVEVHRDIKPQNVLVAPDGTMKLTDFGIARASDLSGLTATGAIVGTPHYMSPEQAMGERATSRSDIYSIGITLYQMLSGELPFIGDTPMAVLEKHRTANPRKLRQVRADVPRALEAIMDRCLAKDPNRRYQTPRELAQALQEAVPAAVTPPPRPRATTPSPATSGSQQPRPTTRPSPASARAGFCTKCGAGLRPGEQFCTACGSPVAGPAQTPRAPSRPPQPTPAARPSASQPYPSTFMRAWESAVRARRSGPLWVRFFALTALLAVVAGVTYVVLQSPTGGSNDPVEIAVPTVTSVPAPAATAASAPVETMVEVAPTATATAFPAVEPTAAPPVPITTEPMYGGTMRVGMLADHITFDPPSLGGLPDIAAVQHTYDGLVFRDADMSIQPALATSWETNADATEWTFHLREGVRFRHGKEFTADDVIFTFDRLFDVGSPLASVMTRPLAIKPVDDLTVVFFFASPNAVLLESLVKYHAYITPSDVRPARFAIETLGTGPFIMTNHEDGGTSFERNPDYWNEGLPLLDKVTFIYISDAEGLAAALVTGRIDVIYDLDIASVDFLRDYPDTVVGQAPSGSYMNLAMDVRQPPFDDVYVRRALQAATHREAILEVALQGLGGIAYDHPILPDDPVFNPNCNPPEYNTRLARQLLAEAGYPNGIDLTLYTSNAGAPMIAMAEVFRRTAAEAGINIDIVVADPDTYWSDVWLQQPFYTSWWGGRHPHEAFSVVYRSGAAWNESYWSNGDVDGLLDLAAREGGLDRQKDIFGALQCIVVEEVPRIIPVFRPVLLGLRENVRGVEPMWDATLSLHRAWLGDVIAPIAAPTATAAPAPTPVVITAFPTPTSVPLPPQPEGPSGTLNVIDDLGNETLLLRAANRVLPLWYIGDPLFWWDWEVDGPTNEAIIESWEFTENAVGSVDWVLNIKPGVKFHKGWGEVTSTDIKFAFTDFLTEGTPSGRQTRYGDFFGSNRPCTTNPDFRRLSVQDRFVHKNQARPLTRELPE